MVSSKFINSIVIFGCSPIHVLCICSVFHMTFWIFLRNYLRHFLELGFIICNRIRDIYNKMAFELLLARFFGQNKCVVLCST